MDFSSIQDLVSPGELLEELSCSQSPTLRSQRSTSGKLPRATALRWTFLMEETLINTLLQEISLGHRSQSGFKDVAWNNALEAVLEVAPNEVKPLITRGKIKGKVDNLRKDWRMWDELCNKRGCTIDPETQCPIAEGAEEFFKVHPAYSKFKKRPLHMAIQLEQLFKDSNATGDRVPRLAETEGSTSIDNSSDPSDTATCLRRKVFINSNRETKEKRSRESAGAFGERLAAAIEHHNQIMVENRATAVERAGKLLWSDNFSSISDEDKAFASQALSVDNTAIMWLTAPLEKQELLLRHYVSLQRLGVSIGGGTLEHSRPH